jgi:hypothetical protein
MCYLLSHFISYSAGKQASQYGSISHSLSLSVCVCVPMSVSQQKQEALQNYFKQQAGKKDNSSHLQTVRNYILLRDPGHPCSV